VIAHMRNFVCVSLVENKVRFADAYEFGCHYFMNINEDRQV